MLRIVNGYCCNSSKLCYRLCDFKEMSRYIQFSAKILLLAFTLSSLPLARAAGTDPAVNSNTNGAAKTSSFRVKPGPDDGRIAFLTAFLLERIHFSQHSFD